MFKSVAVITSDVKVCLDEIGINDAEFLLDGDNRDMNEIIESKIPDAIRYVYLNAGTLFVKPKINNAYFDVDNKGVAIKELPNDFLRFSFAQLDDWSFAATEVILNTDKEYAALKNPITTGYPDNPKAAIVNKAEGQYDKRFLELYSSKKTSENVSGMYGYIAAPSLTTQDGASGYVIEDNVYRAVVYQAAGLTLQAFKDAHADSMFNIALTMMK